VFFVHLQYEETGEIEEKEVSVKQQSAGHSAAPSLTGCILSLVI
jgi:hypothetical protein